METERTVRTTSEEEVVSTPSQRAAQTEPGPTLANQTTRPAQGGSQVPGSSWLWNVVGVAALACLLIVLILLCVFAYRYIFGTPTTSQQPSQQPQAAQTTQQSQNPQGNQAAAANPSGTGNTQVHPGTAVVAPGTTQVNPGTTVVAPGTTQVAPGTTIVTPGTTHVVPATNGQTPVQTHVYAVDPALVATYASSTVSRDNASTATFRIEAGSDVVGFIGPGNHLPRKIIVASCPQMAPIQVNVPVPSVENKIYLPQPPVPPTAPVAPTAPSAPVAPQVQQQTSYVAPAQGQPGRQAMQPTCHGQPVRQVVQRNYGN